MRDRTYGTVIEMATKTGLELLDDVLATYGSDRTRWPAPLRLELSQLLANSPAARSMLADAQSLDRLLDMAPTVGSTRVAALSERIMAQAARTPRVAASGASAAAPRAKPATTPWRRHAAGISALAASLVIGLLAGQNAMMEPAVSELASVVGIDSLSDGSRLAATDETYVSLDEDML